MTDYFVDANRGDDAKNGLSQANAKRTLLGLSALNPNPGAGGGIYLAADSVFVVPMDYAVKNNSRVNLFLFNGTDASNRAFLSSYNPAGVSSGRPLVRSKYYPVAANWQWDATLHNGAPKGWYILYGWAAIGWSMSITVHGVHAVTTNQGNTAGQGFINITTNGMTANTLRYNADTVTPTANRLYLAGLGLSSLVDPTTYFGPGSIAIGGGGFYIYECGAYTVVENIDSDGGTLLGYEAASASKQIPSIEIKDCGFTDNSIAILFASSASGTPLVDVNLHDCSFDNSAGPAVLTYGPGVSGRIHHNSASGSNVASSLGGTFYITSDPLANYLDVEYNFGTDIKSGTGNCTFDGCFVYAESGSTKARIRWNRVENSYKAFQLNNGKYAELVGNVAVNCDVFATCTDVDMRNTSNYLVANNTYYGTVGMNTWPRGTDSATFTNAPLTFTAAGGALTGAVAVNNLFYGRGVSDKAAIRALTTALFAANMTVSNNGIYGFNAVNIGDWNYADQSAGHGTVTSDPKLYDAANDDVRLQTTSPMIGAGTAYALTVSDNKGRRYNTPPAIGAYEKDPFVGISQLLI